MSTTQGLTQNLSQGSKEAFRALINSIAPETATEGDGHFTRETVEKLSAKLNELIGEEAIKNYEHLRNERGELVNEDGLPIIDISEPLLQTEESNHQQEPMIQDIPLIRLSSLPSVAREKLRQHRDRVLDELEEEERQEEERQKQAEREEREELLRKHKAEAVNEQAKLQQTKELQKKMGRALMRNMGFSGNGSDSSLKQEKTEKQEDSQARTDTGERKKTVTFVEANDSGPNASEPEWDDVTAARLRAGKRSTLLQSFRPNATPVKLGVVERKPAAHTSATPSQPTPFTQSTEDSDDESEPEGSQPTPLSDNADSDEASTEGLLESEEDNGEAELENEYDLDYAKHQREIALEYHNKRNTIGQDAARAMTDHSHEEEFKSELALGAPAPNSQSKPSVSRFKANRIASAYGISTGTKPSTSIADSVLPESSTRTVQRSIRSGRIDDDNHLVGGDHDSDSEIEAEGLQETLELLKKGEVYNLGPNGQYLHAPPQTRPNNTQETSAAATTNLNVDKSAATPSGTVAQQQGLQQRSLPPLNRPQISKFKADRSQSGRPSTPSRSETSTSPTPVTHTLRSSPKLPSTLADAVVERKQSESQSTNAPKGARSSPQPVSAITSPVIIDSPSFAAPRANSAQSNTPRRYTSVAIESPSFPNRFTQAMQNSAVPGPSTSFPSMIVDSPSFPPPGQRPRRPERPPMIVSSRNLTTNLSTESDTAKRPMASMPLSGETRVESSHIVAPTVLERAPAPRDNASATGSILASGKVSGFKQSRGGQS